MADVDTMLLTAVAACSAIIAAMVTSLTYFYIEKRRSENETHRLLLQRQEQAYSQLMGLEVMTSQLYVSMIGAITLFAYNMALERLERPCRSELGKIGEKHREYNELALELARTNQRLLETIGLIRVLFSPSEELDKLIEPFKPSMIKLREHRESITDYYKNVTVDNVNTWPEAATAGLDEAIITYVEFPFESLQKYIEDKIRDEKDLAKNWWQFWQ